MQKIAIISDAWNQTNGVVTTLENLKNFLNKNGIATHIIHADNSHKKIKCPSYNSIKLSITPWKAIEKIKNFNPDHIHIATEGPIGVWVGIWCKIKGIKFTTSYHTKFPEYINMRFSLIPKSLIYFILKKFHNMGEFTLVATDSMKNELENKKFSNLKVWSRGVSRKIFYPNDLSPNNIIKKLLYVGRVSIEKNLQDFLDLKLDINHEKIVIGDGPDLKKLKKSYPDVIFLGLKKRKELREFYASSDVFVFPSKSDTFGLVMLESIACGTPVAAYNVSGPKDILTNGVNGYMSDDLKLSIKKCLEIKRYTCYDSSKQYTWKETTEVFLRYIKKIYEESNDSRRKINI